MQATIAARIDRLDPKAKRTLGAAAVIGSRFGLDLLTSLGVEPAVADLVGRRTHRSGQVYRPTRVWVPPSTDSCGGLRITAQIRSCRGAPAGWRPQSNHRDPAAADENAALIAEHLEAAGDPHAAYGWHMRAGVWALTRDVAAAWASWQRARQVADALPADDSDRLSIRIAPRAWLCASAFRVHVDISDSLFEELKELCTAAGDKPSLAMGMAGLIAEHLRHGRVREASRLASETMALVESIGKPDLTVGVSLATISTKFLVGEMAEALRWSQTLIELAPVKWNGIHGSPLAVALAYRGTARCALGRAGWRDDFDRALAMTRGADPMSHTAVIAYAYGFATAGGVRLADDAALREIEAALQSAERSSEDYVLGRARFTLGVALAHRASPAERERGLAVLGQVREMCLEGRFYRFSLAAVDIYTALERARCGDRDSAISQMRAAIDDMFHSETTSGTASRRPLFLVETLLERGAAGDLARS